MNTATRIKLQHIRHARGTGVVKYDMDALVEHLRDECLAEFHHDDIGVSEYVFVDNSALTIFHPVVDVVGEDFQPTESNERVGGHESVQAIARGRVGVLRSLVRLFKREGAQS